MDAILQFLQQSPLLIIILLVVVALIFSRVASPKRGKDEPVPDELKVPAYKRFERRETDMGNRRGNEKADAKAPPANADRRSVGRRAGDWLRGRR